MKKKSLLIIGTLALATLIIYSCSKGSDDPSPPPNPCAGITVLVTGTTTTTSSSTSADGSITATATGGSGFTYQLGTGAFQSSGSFTGLAAGTYTITAKNSNGCTGSAQFSVTAGNICAGFTITVTGTATSATPCVTPANGSVTVTATGSTGLTYSINGGAFQASNTFSNLAAGNYTVTAKNANGCTGTSATITVGTATAGPLFSAVRTLLDSRCVGCHNAGNANGGMNWTVDCNVVNNKDRIKARAVDNNPSSMPPTGPLPQADKDKITAWINAGGRYTD